MWPPLTAEALEEDFLEEENAEKEEDGPWQPPALAIPTWPVLQARTGLVYDQRMMGHYNLWDKYAVRGPSAKWTGRSLPLPQVLSPASGSCPLLPQPPPRDASASLSDHAPFGRTGPCGALPYVAHSSRHRRRTAHLPQVNPPPTLVLGVGWGLRAHLPPPPEGRGCKHLTPVPHLCLQC